jgi:hypothetical protein
VVDNNELATTLADLGYTVVDTPAADVLWVAHQYTKELQEAVQSGVRLLVIAGTDFAKAPESIRLPIAGVIAREQTHWQGDWATSFSWLKKQGPFAHLPGNPLLEMEYATIMPDAIIVGTPAWAYGDRSWAGLALGWIHKPVSLLLKAPYGDGQITVTTFKLSAAAVREDAMAQALMVGVVNLAAAE